jgi:hypothetical protein
VDLTPAKPSADPVAERRRARAQEALAKRMAALQAATPEEEDLGFASGGLPALGEQPESGLGFAAGGLK